MRRLAAPALVLAVIAAGWWLLWPSPGGVRLTIGSATHIVTVTLDSARVGDHDITVSVTDRAGAPETARSIQLVAVLPTMGYLSPVQTAPSVNSGRFVAAGVSLMAPGGWQLLVTVPGAAGPDRIPVPVTVTG
ncbi:hypothetical protein BJ973_000159 [Actinoplanes tereljensis]|uniref:YtkA-like domain-containing protein n=1 Tax=Paractinoplanes tereljensis TaxID=571912 RepID=A0A919TZY2_9ACTN|nr:hypothetical protein [Actinoplanes tereljensis]GIF26750.1 hypothetical protein Ate02nite_94800 [Actinoplanes tereljensis]